MEEDIRMNGDWYIPETDETIAGTLYINKVQKRILLQLTKVATEDDLIIVWDSGLQFLYL